MTKLVSVKLYSCSCLAVFIGKSWVFFYFQNLVKFPPFSISIFEISNLDPLGFSVAVKYPVLVFTKSLNSNFRAF